MSERVTIDVPKPWTRVVQGHQAVSGERSGFSATTHGHVWLTAYHGSTLTTHAAGAHRFVSTDDKVVVVGKKSVLQVTDGGVTVAAGGGIRVIGGHKADPELSPADQDIDTPDAADDVTDGCDTVAQAWEAANLAVNALFASKKVGMAVLAGPANARMGADAALVAGVLGVVSNVATSAVSAAATGGGDIAGINIHGMGGINLFTPAFASFYGMSGTLFASPFSTQVLGLATVGVTGLATAGMSALGKADLSSASGVSVVASGPVQVKSMPGEVVMKGSSVNLGQILPDKKCPAQLPTATIGLGALAGMRMASPKGTVRLGRVVADLAEETKLKAMIDAWEAVDQTKSKSQQKNVKALAALFTVKDMLTKPVTALDSLTNLQLPNKDPIFTMTNDVKVGGAGAVLVKESVKLQVGSWVVEVSKKGITIGNTTTKPEEPGAVKTIPVKPQALVTKEGVELKQSPTGGQLSVKSNMITTKSGGKDAMRITQAKIQFLGKMKS